MQSDDDSPALNIMQGFLAEELLTEPKIKPLEIQSVSSNIQKNLCF